jgi:hypothetical protein
MYKKSLKIVGRICKIYKYEQTGNYTYNCVVAHIKITCLSNGVSLKPNIFTNSFSEVLVFLKILFKF